MYLRKDNSNMALLVMDQPCTTSPSRGAAPSTDKVWYLALRRQSASCGHHEQTKIIINRGNVRSELIGARNCFVASKAARACASARWSCATLPVGTLVSTSAANMTLTNLKIINRAYWNNDGIDVTDCRNVRITGCNVTAADDGICLKSYHADSCNDPSMYPICGYAAAQVR